MARTPIEWVVLAFRLAFYATGVFVGVAFIMMLLGYQSFCEAR